MILTERIEQLEALLHARSVRLHWISLLAAFLSLIALVVTLFRADYRADSIVTEQFRLIDKDGNPLLVMGPSRAGTGQILVLNPKVSATIASISATDAGMGQIISYDGRDRNMAALTFSDAGDPVIGVAENGNTRASLWYETGRGGALTVHDSKGRDAFAAGVYKEGGGAIWIQNTEGKDVVVAGAMGEEWGGLWVKNASGKPGVVMDAELGWGRIVTFNSNGTPRVWLGESEHHEGMIATYSRKGQPLATIGGDGKGRGTIATTTHTGRKLADIGADASSNGIIRLNDNTGHVTWNANINTNGNPVPQ